MGHIDAGEEEKKLLSSVNKMPKNFPEAQLSFLLPVLAPQTFREVSQDTELNARDRIQFVGPSSGLLCDLGVNISPSKATPK